MTCKWLWSQTSLEWLLFQDKKTRVLVLKRSNAQAVTNNYSAWSEVVSTNGLEPIPRHCQASHHWNSKLFLVATKSYFAMYYSTIGTTRTDSWLARFWTECGRNKSLSDWQWGIFISASTRSCPIDHSHSFSCLLSCANHSKTLIAHNYSYDSMHTLQMSCWLLLRILCIA